MKVSKEVLQELLYESATDDFKVVRERITGHSRWSVQSEQILQHIPTGRFYVTSFSKGATESQDESPYEYDDDEIELDEVVAVEKTVTDYEPITPIDP